MCESFRGLHVVVMGLGRFGGGVGVSRWLHRQGAHVTVTDLAPAEQLAGSIEELAELDLMLHLGGHDDADLDECDLLVVNPAVPDDASFLLEARRRDVPMTTEMNLFLERCPAAIVGITGSAGKSTTAAMTAAILATKFTTHLGGNIGRSLLEDLADGKILDHHLVILELSSFQLDRTPPVQRSPQVAVVTNVQPNHLDRHGTMEAYMAAKKNIFRYQRPGDWLIVNADDQELVKWLPEAPARTWTFSASAEPFELAIPGRHNQLNAQAAWAVGRALGVSRADTTRALKGFQGLPNRLALVAERGGVRYYDDSKATTPAATMLGLRSFPSGRVVAIVGGFDKQVPLDRLCAELGHRCKAVVATGQVGPEIARRVRRSAPRPPGPDVILADRFDDAVAAAMRSAVSGDVVLLSPACASYGQFLNYVQRGRRFQELVQGPE